MAAFLGVNATKVAAVPSQMVPSGQLKGEIQAGYEEYVSLANITAADTISTAIVIPAGARVKDISMVVPTNGGSVQVGIAGTAAKYGTFTPGSATLPYIAAPNTVDETIILTSSVSATATGTYRVLVSWILL